MQLLAAADTVAAQQKREHPPRRWREPGVWAAGVAFACLVMLAAGYAQLTFLVRDQGDTSTRTVAILERQDAQRHQISDCVTPGGKCYERGQRTTAAAVQQLITQITVNVCDAVNERPADVRRCIRRLVQEQEQNR